jgi:hypothetical protein
MNIKILLGWFIILFWFTLSLVIAYLAVGWHGVLCIGVVVLCIISMSAAIHLITETPFK